ncbi:MAG TPA: hypothetical protein VLV83_15130 [Acidobacteriota bacterium]|nr:hypothetical protein [Acidobacteriota bacterium]
MAPADIEKDQNYSNLSMVDFEPALATLTFMAAGSLAKVPASGRSNVTQTAPKTVAARDLSVGCLGDLQCAYRALGESTSTRETTAFEALCRQSARGADDLV